MDVSHSLFLFHSLPICTKVYGGNPPKPPYVFGSLYHCLFPSLFFSFSLFSSLSATHIYEKYSKDTPETPETLLAPSAGDTMEAIREIAGEHLNKIHFKTSLS